MIDMNPDIRVNSYARWLALSQWKNEGGAGNDPTPPEGPPQGRAPLQTPSGQCGTGSEERNRSGDGAKQRASRRGDSHGDRAPERNAPDPFPHRSPADFCRYSAEHRQEGKGR